MRRQAIRVAAVLVTIGVAAGAALARPPAASRNSSRVACGAYGNVPRDERAVVSRDLSTLAWSEQPGRLDRQGRVMVAAPDASRAHAVSVPDPEYDALEAISPDGSEALIAKDRHATASALVLAATGNTRVRVVSRAEATAIRRAWRTPEWSSDGRFRVEATTDGLWIERADGTGRRRLAAMRFGFGAAWSPDGSLIAFTADHVYNTLGELYAVRPDGTGLHRIGDVDGVSSIAWSPDSTRIAYEIDASAYDAGWWIGVASVESGGANDLTAPHDAPDERRAGAPAWLDADTIVFTAYEGLERGPHRVIGLRAIEADGSRERRLTYHCHLGWNRSDRGYGAFGDLHGSDFGDVMRSFAGNDRVFAEGGADDIDAGPGNDLVNAGAGNDLVRGGPGNDVLFAGLPGGRERDVVDCGPGRDMAVVGLGATVRGCERVTRRR